MRLRCGVLELGGLITSANDDAHRHGKAKPGCYLRNVGDVSQIRRGDGAIQSLKTTGFATEGCARRIRKPLSN